LNFRLREVAFTADIEKAFLQMSLNEPDRDLVRFLWVEDYTCANEDLKFIWYRYTRPPFGVNSCPFLLNMVVLDLFAETNNSIFQFTRNRFYVDNFVVSVSTVAHAVQTIEKVSERLARASFNLRDWASNSVDLMNAIPTELHMQEEDPISILGMGWNRTQDTMQFFFKEEENSLPYLTLRLALSALASVFDPMGLCAACLLELKRYAQSCWKIKAGWGEPLPQNMEPQYLKLMSEREEIKKLVILRYL